MKTTGGRPVAFARSTCCISCSTIVVASVLDNLESFMSRGTTDGRFKLVCGEEGAWAKRLVKPLSFHLGFFRRAEEATLIMNEPKARESESSIPGHLTALIRHFIDLRDGT